MRSKKLSIGLRAAVAMFAVTLLAASALATEKKLHNFGHGTDGSSPAGPLIMDAHGNLYGTTQQGGDYADGTVFELSPNGSGGWTEKKLHNFGHGNDGFSPNGGLTLDAAGNLYGTLAYSGYGSCNPCGTVFELSPNGSGGWTEKRLHNFSGGNDGGGPAGGLIFDAAGNLYGTTYAGGDNRCYYGDYNIGCGTAFELSPTEDGHWTEKKLHNFGSGADGVNPRSALVFDAAGNLYGITAWGGRCGWGTAFRLSPREGGGWTEKVLHSFNCSRNDPTFLFGGLTLDAAGDLYSTSNDGGAYAGGTVFELSPQDDGGWTQKILHNFPSNGHDGWSPAAGLIFDAVGNLYGTTSIGGSHRSCNGGYGCGTVFELLPNGTGGWREKVLHNFGDGMDGQRPSGPVTFDGAGNLYGTTSNGGDYGAGTVFEITP